MAHDVFISHSSSDKPVADSVCAVLENAGIRCWIAPRDVQPGRPFAGEITRAIQQSKVLVLIFSSRSNNSEQVLREVQLAAESHLHIVQFRIEDTHINDDLRYYLSTPHWLDALTPPLENHLARLEVSIAALLKISAEGAEEQVQVNRRAAAQASPASNSRQSRAITSDPSPGGGTDAGTKRSVTDLAPLLKEESRKFRNKAEAEGGAENPIDLWLNFPRALVAGFGSIIEARLENPGDIPLQNIELILESKGLRENVQTTCRHVAAGGSAYLCLEVMPNGAGNFVLRCNIKGRKKDRAYALRGTIPITINIAPESANLTANLSGIQRVRGTGPVSAFGHEFGAENISNLLLPGSVQTINDLLNTTFPEAFGKVRLELNYEVTQSALTQLNTGAGCGWIIPPQFLGNTQSGTILILEPISGPAAPTILPIHLVAREKFRISRSLPPNGDFLTWFWPRSEENDEKTKRLSKKHVVAAVHGDKLILRDEGSANGATFEGHPLFTDRDEVLDQRGTLILAHEYHLDITPFESTVSRGLQIANERDWPGPPVVRRFGTKWGSVRFTPINSEIAQYHALWFFTDANFGHSPLNPIMINASGLAEVEGRFHYHRQNFWIEDLPEGTVVSVERHQLAPREIVPLATGNVIEIGKVTFRARIEP
jgi:hypothetical protein